MLIYEFQREDRDGEWEPLGIARIPSGQLDVGAAVESLRATQRLEPGAYRVRAVEAEHRWHYGEVDENGEFRRIDVPTDEIAI